MFLKSTEAVTHESPTPIPQKIVFFLYILLNKDKIKVDYEFHRLLLVPYDSLNNHGLLRCIIPKSIYIQGVGFRNNLLVGISNEEIMIDGVDCILHSKIIERVVL